MNEQEIQGEKELFEEELDALISIAQEAGELKPEDVEMILRRASRKLLIQEINRRYSM